MAPAVRLIHYSVFKTFWVYGVKCLYFVNLSCWDGHRCAGAGWRQDYIRDVLVCQRSRNQAPHTACSNSRNHSLAVRRSPDVGRALLPLKALGEDLFQVKLGSSLACDCDSGLPMTLSPCARLHPNSPSLEQYQSWWMRNLPDPIEHDLISSNNMGHNLTSK